MFHFETKNNNKYLTNSNLHSPTSDGKVAATRPTYRLNQADHESKKYGDDEQETSEETVERHLNFSFLSNRAMVRAEK